MQNLLRVILSAAFLVSSIPSKPVIAQDVAAENLSRQLQKALNNAKGANFSFLKSKDYAANLRNRHNRFLSRFPNAKWIIRPSLPLQDGRTALEILVTGNQVSNNQEYSLEAKQKLALNTDGSKIIGEELISEYSILRTNKNQLPMTFSIPDEVLTGTRYDIDLIFDDPLGDAIIAGGLINLSPQQILSKESPHIELEPMGGGGLFKSVTAPINPGTQVWSGLIAHPDGLISITKRVNIVANNSQITN